MFSKNEFVRWVETFHNLFEIFEGRYDAYPLARKWIDEWFLNGEFTIRDSDKQRIINLINNLNFDAFEIKDQNLQKNIKNQLFLLLEKLNERPSNVGFAISFFLFTWNLQRFGDYFKMKSNFSLLEYFENIGDGLESLKKQFEFFRRKNMLSDEIYDGKIVDIYSNINEILKAAGIGNNEPIGTIKLLHVFSPHYFPLLDNPIAEKMGLKKPRTTINVELYVEWMRKLKSWLGNYGDAIDELENKYGYSILKLVDEGFFVMCSINLKMRIDELRNKFRNFFV